MKITKKTKRIVVKVAKDLIKEKLGDLQTEVITVLVDEIGCAHAQSEWDFDEILDVANDLFVEAWSSVDADEAVGA